MLANHDKRVKQLIHYATQAPSGHNSQPWKFRIKGNCINIFPDFTRELPHADPQDRELYISLGCATENLVLAADALGIETEVQLLPYEEGAYSIQVWLHEQEISEPDQHTLDILDQRQTNRSVYRREQLSPNMINEIQRLPKEKGVHIHIFQNGNDPFDLLKSMILRASAIQMKDRDYKKELINWVRFNPKQVSATEDGMSYETIGAPAMPPFIGRVIMSSLLNPVQQNKEELKKINSSSHFLLLTTDNNETREWIRLGRYLERILVHLTDLGIASAYANPPCQVETVAKDLQGILQIDDYPTVLLRIGFADKMPYSHRRPVDQVIESESN